LLVGTIALTLMLCWRRGRAVALNKRAEDDVLLDQFLRQLAAPNASPRTPGTAVYLTQQSKHVPAALALNLKHNGVVHEHVLLLKVTTDRTPRIPESARLEVKDLSGGFQTAELHFGFAETPDVPAALAAHRDAVKGDPIKASFFFGREYPVPSLRPELPRWQERVYAFMTRNAVRAPDYFLIPHEQVVELGTRVEM